MKRTSTAALAAFILVTAAGAHAQPPGPMPGPHPAYLRALSDLREAMWLVNKNAGNNLSNSDEIRAIKEMQAAVQEIRAASIDDGKDANYQPPPDAVDEHEHRLTRAIKVLADARDDLSHNEDNQYAQGLRDHSIHHINDAIRLVESASATKRNDY